MSPPARGGGGDCGGRAGRWGPFGTRAAVGQAAVRAENPAVRVAPSPARSAASASGSAVAPCASRASGPEASAARPVSAARSRAQAPIAVPYPDGASRRRDSAPPWWRGQ